MADDSAVQQTNDKMSSVDTASLTFFTNPHYLNILNRKKLCYIKDNAEEVKFYRKRIVSLFKDILKNPDETIHEEIKEIHAMFVNASIRCFEIIDKKDIIQSQYFAQQKEDNDDLQLELDTILIENAEIFTIDEANDIMIRKIIAVPNLDNYVIAKTDISANETRIIPIKIDINLKTDDLKKKGIRPKKHNKIKI